MFLLRRTAARALSAAPAKTIVARPRSIATVAPRAFRSKQQQCITLALQRRFVSDESESRAATEAPETFAQTATEAPVDETVTPATHEAEPTDSTATVGIDALQAAAETQKQNPDGTTPRRSPDSTPPNRTLYIGNLYYEVTEDQLSRVFSRFGTVKSTKVIFDNRGLSRGFAYVEFENISDAQAAVENLDMQVFEGRNLVVQFHRPRETSRRGAPGSMTENPPSRTLFIGNMSFEMSDKDLNDLFRDIRNVMDVRVAIDRRTGQPRGFAHADFIDVNSATKAQEELKNKVVYGRQLRVDFSKSTTQHQQRERQPRSQQGEESQE
ncbi:RNA binding domain-containing protein [Polyplosphaeria fusca]|uniref:RNA binding domain-containing protein n=1 Tax=Polyplosphaeria fusca TaxID=682080 RepID=A0A9P4V7B6_9PLEO|nr:RNA binding domain-containing protein [Polyplosphaeria fusca]